MRSYPLELRLLLSGSSFSVHRLRCGTRVNVRFRSTSDFSIVFGSACSFVPIGRLMHRNKRRARVALAY